MNTYSIGQMRRNQFSNYSTPVNYRFDLLVDDSSIINFYNPCIFATGINSISFVYSYYLKFEIQQLANSPQDITIKLKNSENNVEDYQVIRQIHVNQGIEKTSFELIFNPNTNYNEVVFELNRIALDYNLDNHDGTSGRISQIKIDKFERVNNVISNYLSTAYHGLTTLKKIGIQGPPGLIFCVNGEEIHIGRSGVYELYYEDLEISYIGFILKDSLFTQDGKDFFIMDFKY